ncbi:Histone H4-like protein [Mycena kentingensis (nom. inval.)]|nr:Histone H4-like protein [Mycena kentingensis (nom. inval.)]
MSAPPDAASPRPKRRRMLRHYSEMVYVGQRPTIKRLARRGGVKRIHGRFYEEARADMYGHLKKLVETTVLHTLHNHRRTVTKDDIRRALQCARTSLYG